MNLLEAHVGQTYKVACVSIADKAMNSFLMRLGCYPGEPITLISKKKKICIVVIKGSRYSIDSALAKAVEVCEE